MSETQAQPTPVGAKIVGVIVVVIIFLTIGWIFNGIIKSGNEMQDNSNTAATKVQDELDSYDSDMKSSLATTSSGGHRGSIESVRAGSGDGEVIVKVSTYFDDADEGKIIARNIFNSVCMDIPDLDSLYVTGGNGLDSYSVYRSDYPGCK